MKNYLFPGILGFLFAVGLGLSGMTQPQKVIGFLDIFGNWDPSLMFVMIGAISVHAISYLLKNRMQKPILDLIWHVPNRKQLSFELIFGSILFGIGWGLAGFCPGPALVSILTLKSDVILFVLSMFTGMFFFNVLNRKFHFKK